MPFGIQISKRQIGDRKGASNDACDEDQGPKRALIPGEQCAA